MSTSPPITFLPVKFTPYQIYPNVMLHLMTSKTCLKKYDLYFLFSFYSHFNWLNFQPSVSSLDEPMEFLKKQLTVLVSKRKTIVFLVPSVSIKCNVNTKYMIH